MLLLLFLKINIKRFVIIHSPVVKCNVLFLGGGQGGGRVMTPETRRRSAMLGKVLNVVSSRSPTQKDADRRLFMGQLADPDARDDFERHGWTSALNAEAIFAFWSDLEPGLFDGT